MGDFARAKPIIEVRDLHKEYPLGEETVVALGQINLEICRGEICCIFGTSGSGKSTLLNMLAGMEKPRPDPASRRITDLLLAGHRLDEAETRVQMNPCLRFRLRFGEKEPLHRQLPGALQKLRHLFQAGNQGSSLPLATTYPRNRELSSRPVKKVLLQFNFYHCFSGRFPV